MKKNKALALALVLGIFASLSLGSGSASSGTEVDKEVSEVDTNSSSESSMNTESDTESVAEVTIEEQVLYDDNDVKITATSLEDGWFGTELKLLIENNSDKSITVQARGANVNGFMVDTMMSADVAPGKKANDELTFETSGLKDCGIESVAVMEFYFHVFDSSTWEEIFDTDFITVKTSVADTYVQDVDDSGEVLVDSNGIKIVTKGLSENGSFWGPGVILYIENNSDENITIQVRDVSINGFMVDSSMSEDVVSGKKAISDVQFFSSDLEDNNITDINEVELYFHIFNEETWNDILDSDVITIKF